MLRPLIAAAASALVVVAPAQAASVVSPRDGQTVPARPDFVFNLQRGIAEVEMSKHPDTKTAGDEAGRFLELAKMNGWERTDEAGGLWTVPWLVPSDLGSPIEAGRYYWHVRFNDQYAGWSPWGPTMTLTVRDEPAVLEGWRLTARRAKRSRRCKSPLRLSGHASFTDNTDAFQLKARWVLKLRAAGRTVARVEGRSQFDDIDIAETVCVRARRLTARLSLIDASRQVTTSEPKTVRVTG